MDPVLKRVNIFAKACRAGGGPEYVAMMKGLKSESELAAPSCSQKSLPEIARKAGLARVQVHVTRACRCVPCA